MKRKQPTAMTQFRDRLVASAKAKRKPVSVAAQLADLRTAYNELDRLTRALTDGLQRRCANAEQRLAAVERPRRLLVFCDDISSAPMIYDVAECLADYSRRLAALETRSPWWCRLRKNHPPA